MKSNLEGFLKALDQLSREYGVWIEKAEDAQIVDGDYNTIAEGLYNNGDDQKYYVNEKFI